MKSLNLIFVLALVTCSVVLVQAETGPIIKYIHINHIGYTDRPIHSIILSSNDLPIKEFEGLVFDRPIKIPAAYYIKTRLYLETLAARAGKKNIPVGAFGTIRISECELGSAKTKWKVELPKSQAIDELARLKQLFEDEKEQKKVVEALDNMITSLHQFD